MHVQTKAAGLPGRRGVARAIGGRVAWGGSAVSMGSTKRPLDFRLQVKVSACQMVLVRARPWAKYINPPYLELLAGPVQARPHVIFFFVLCNKLYLLVTCIDIVDLFGLMVVELFPLFYS